jgi:hypothetical protein
MAVWFKEKKLQKITWSLDCEGGYVWNQNNKKRENKPYTPMKVQMGSGGIETLSLNLSTRGRCLVNVRI